ncbi:MAG: hypothetical protein KDB03_18985 [Planctomycetales bacterium]|nr:hypothetical protein [Planctomycetales bacterium]
MSQASGVIAGNYIGTDIFAAIAMPNGFEGISYWNSSGPMLIGTNSDGVADSQDRNVIVGFHSIAIAASGAVVTGNYLGTNSTGSAAIGNGSIVLGGHDNRVGTNGDGQFDGMEMNLISSGMLLVDTYNNVVAGNHIGTDITGSYTLYPGPASDPGIGIYGNSHHNRIGTNGDGVSDEAERNIIAGATYGIFGGGNNNQITGNNIGVNAHGEPLGNSRDGIRFSEGAHQNQVGGNGALANLIAFNRENGISITSGSPGTDGHAIRGNSIFSNGQLGIDLSKDGVTPNDFGDSDAGPNNLQNYPVLTSTIGGSTTQVAGTLNSLPNTSFLIDFYANTVVDPSGYGEGERWLGVTMVTTDANGDAAFSVTLAAATSPGEYITSTATRLEDDDADPATPLLETDTSEFSAALLVPANQPPVISAQAFALDENQLVVGTVFASDDDLPDDIVSFALTGNGPDDARFELSTSGELSFLAATDFENPTDTGGTPGDNVYLVEVRVTDAAGAVAINTMTVTVNNVTATISGTVFVDANQNGLFDGGAESAIDGVLIELLDEFGLTLDSDTTAMGGVYAFEVDDEFATYRIRETQPTGVADGQAVVGDANGNNLTGEAVDGFVLSSNEMQLTLTGIAASDYDFTEYGQAIQSGDTATIGFWQNKNGQALIELGGAQLVSWMNINFSNIFGSTFSDGAGGDDAAEVARLYKDEFFRKKLQGSSKVDAQFMALALSTFFTSSNLSGGNTAAVYGFNVTETGIGTKVVNVGASGAAFNLPDHSDATIMSLLLATNNLTGADTDSDASEDYSHVYDLDGDGILDDYEKSLREMANFLYSLINESGDI